MKINGYTFQISSGPARLTLTYTNSGTLVTTHEYGGALVKRVSVQGTVEETRDLHAWLGENLARRRLQDD